MGHFPTGTVCKTKIEIKSAQGNSPVIPSQTNPWSSTKKRKKNRFPALNNTAAISNLWSSSKFVVAIGSKKLLLLWPIYSFSLNALHSLSVTTHKGAEVISSFFFFCEQLNPQGEKVKSLHRRQKMLCSSNIYLHTAHIHQCCSCHLCSSLATWAFVPECTAHWAIQSSKELNFNEKLKSKLQTDGV